MHEKQSVNLELILKAMERLIADMYCNDQDCITPIQGFLFTPFFATDYCFHKIFKFQQLFVNDRIVYIMFFFSGLQLGRCGFWICFLILQWRKKLYLTSSFATINKWELFRQWKKARQFAFVPYIRRIIFSASLRQFVSA